MQQKSATEERLSQLTYALNGCEKKIILGLWTYLCSVNKEVAC